MSKIKLFIHPKLRALIAPYIDTKKITYVTQNEAELCVVQQASHSGKNIYFMNDAQVQLGTLGNYLSLLKCPYSHKAIYAMSNSKIIFEIFNKKIAIQKTAYSQAKVMITYWQQASCLFKNLMNWQKRLLLSHPKFSQTAKDTHDRT